MNRLLLIVFFVDLAVLLGVGGRLLWVARRTRRAPEAAIGTSAACGSLGILLSLIATVILDRGDGSFPIWAAGTLVRAIGVCGLSIGCWRIYRPTESWEDGRWKGQAK